MTWQIYKAVAIFLVVVLILNFVYVYATPYERTVIIVEKYNYAAGSGRSLSIMNTVSDDSNRIYRVGNCLPLLHFTAAEVLLSISAGSKYKLKGYGFRVPILGWYPNITSAIKQA